MLAEKQVLCVGSPNQPTSLIISNLSGQDGSAHLSEAGAVSQFWPRVQTIRKIHGDKERSKVKLRSQTAAWDQVQRQWPELDPVQQPLGTRQVWGGARSPVRGWSSRDQWPGRGMAEVGWDQHSYNIARGRPQAMLVRAINAY